MPYYLVSGGYTETLEKVRLVSRPGDEFVQAARVESRVRARQGPQGAPACGLALGSVTGIVIAAAPRAVG